MSAYTYGATKRERVWLTIPIKVAPGFVTTKLKIVICPNCRIGKRIVEGQSCSACVAFGMGDK